MTREEAINQVDALQDEYINELCTKYIENKNDPMKEINFTAPTGSGKTKMMAKLIKKLPQYFYIITSLSKAELYKQIEDSIDKDMVNAGINKKDNYIVFGTASYKRNTKLDAETILKQIPKNRQVIWIRDEAHINTNNFTKLLESRVFKIINFSATNDLDTGIQCKFSNTVMLRSVHQSKGTPEEAIEKLVEIQKEHEKYIPKSIYRPCAIFRCVKGTNKNENLLEEDENIINRIEIACIKYGLTCVRIKDGKEVLPLCDDNSNVDVIINKFIITEGVDIRRAHVLYMDNQPGNNATTIQAIGRCRRNALLWNKDLPFDIFNDEYADLFNKSMQCYVYYNVKNMKIPIDENGELQNEFCNKISIQRLKAPCKISVVDGQLKNGLYVEELRYQKYNEDIDDYEEFGYTGTFTIEIDKYYKDTYDLYYNVISNNDIEKYNIRFYNEIIINPYSILYKTKYNRYYSIPITELKSIGISNTISIRDYSDENAKYKNINVEPYYKLYLLDSKYKSDFIKKHNIREEKREDSIKTNKKLGRIFSDDNRPEVSKIKIYEPYNKCVNNRELAILGCEQFRQVSENEWTTSRSMGSKVNISSKFGQFITAKYSEELDYFKIKRKEVNLKIKETKKNEKDDEHKFPEFKNLDTKCNSCIGYCVEFYSKYLVYGEKFLRNEYIDYIKLAQSESNTNKINDGIIVRACMLKYKYFMLATFGGKVDTVIPTLSTNKIIDNNYKVFVKKVVTLGTRTAAFIKNTLGNINDTIYPVISTKYISGLVDYITPDTILDIKTTNGISEGHIRQVLAYHYLSTTRSDVNIKKVIVYDCISDSSIIIPISKENLKGV